jgi:hypothetical protein
MSVQSETPRENGIVPLVRAIMVVLLLGVAGLIAVYGTRFPRWSDLIAIVVACMCAAGAARLMAESFDPVALGKRMCVEGPGTAKEAAQVRLQALLMFVLGLTLAWPPLATLAGYPAPIWSYAVIAAFVVIRLVYTHYMFERGDEFLRQRVRNSTWRSYFIGQTALLAYAGGERLGLVPPLTAWDVLTLTMALSIVVTAFGPMVRART